MYVDLIETLDILDIIFWDSGYLNFVLSLFIWYCFNRGKGTYMHQCYCQGVVRSPGIPFIIHWYPRAGGEVCPFNFWPRVAIMTIILTTIDTSLYSSVWIASLQVPMRYLPTLGCWWWGTDYCCGLVENPDSSLGLPGYHNSWKAEVCLLLLGQIRTPGFLFSLFVYDTTHWGCWSALLEHVEWRWQSRLLIELCWCWWVPLSSCDG